MVFPEIPDLLLACSAMVVLQIPDLLFKCIDLLLLFDCVKRQLFDLLEKKRAHSSQAHAVSHLFCGWYFRQMMVFNNHSQE